MGEKKKSNPAPVDIYDDEFHTNLKIAKGFINQLGTRGAKTTMTIQFLFEATHWYSRGIPKLEITDFLYNLNHINLAISDGTCDDILDSYWSNCSRVEFCLKMTRVLSGDVLIEAPSGVKANQLANRKPEPSHVNMSADFQTFHIERKFDSVDKQICRKWIAKLVNLKSDDPVVKKNRNSFFRYLLSVMEKAIKDSAHKVIGDGQANVDENQFMCKWSNDKRTYIAAKPLPGVGTLVYLAVAKDPKLGWDHP